MPPLYEYIAIASLVIIVASRFYHKGHEQGYEDCKGDHKEFIEEVKKVGEKIEEEAFLKGQYYAVEKILKESTKLEKKENEQEKDKQNKDEG